MKKVLFRGSATALVTPFCKDGSVNFEVLFQLVEYQIKSGTQALVVLGTTGESPTVSYEERKEIISKVVNQVNKRIPVIVGTGSNSTKIALNLSKEAEFLGADGLLIVTPFYNKTSQAGLVEHYKFIAENVNLPIILYNVPSRTGVNILPQTYKKLSEISNIVATKEANGDISSIIETKSLCGDDLNIYSGNDDQTLPIMSVGGIGVVSVFSNIMPKESQMIANGENSKNLLMKYYDLMDALFCDVNPIPVKHALNFLGVNCGKCRLPLWKLSDDNKKKLEDILMKREVKISL